MDIVCADYYKKSVESTQRSMTTKHYKSNEFEYFLCFVGV